MMSAPSSHSELQHTSTKRQRVSTACLSCRGKRMRCDGQQPFCGPCIKRGSECKYQHAENKRRTPSKKYVESLQTRIRQLEAQLTSLGSQIAASSYQSLEFHESDDTGSESNDEDADDPLAELTGRIGRLTVIEDGQLHYFGSQSSYNLVQEPRHDTTPHLPSLRMRRQGLAAAAQLGKLVTVSDEVQEHLLDLYWRWQNPWNYVVHKSSFLKSYRGEDDGKYCSPLLLSSIFALAARYSDRPELCSVPGDPSTAGEAFCEQAKILMLYESEAPTVATVQAACLLALRLMSDGKEALGWLYCGNATRMAHNLGLHLDCANWTSKGILSEDEAKIRNVTWWGCYFIDKLFALGLGRPSNTSRSTITCPMPRLDGDEEYAPWTPDLNSPKSLSAHSYIASTAYYNSESMTIACEAMDNIYAANSRLSTREIENVVSRTDVELQSYYRALPTYLRLPASPKIPTLPHIYLFHIQFHAHLILLHRPLVQRKKSRVTASNRLSIDTSDNDNEDHMNQHMATCRESATEITKLLRLYKHHFTLRRVPIAAVHLCFSAVVIHLIDARPSSPERNQAIRRLQTCVEVLRDLRTAWCAWSNRAVRAVQLMAREWYQCDDLSQLRHCDETSRFPSSYANVEAERKPATELEDDCNDEKFSLIDAGAPDIASTKALDPPPSHSDISLEAVETDPFAFLFDDTAMDQLSDNAVREWIAEQGYDLFDFNP